MLQFVILKSISKKNGDENQNSDSNIFWPKPVSNYPQSIYWMQEKLRDQFDFEIFDDFRIWGDKNPKNGQKNSKVSLTIFIHFPTNRMKQ